MERLISDFGYNDKKFYLELGRYLAAEMGFNVYGPFCTSVDKFAWDKSGKQIRVSDYIVQPKTGAYRRSMSPKGFLSHPQVPEIFLK